MSKFRKILIVLLVACIAVCLSVALAACKDDSDDFINPGGNGDTSDDGTFNGNYVISVVSLGGLPLDGIKVSAQKGGSEIKAGISVNGIINLTLTPDVYDLVVDESSLPKGYFIPEGSDFKTKSDEGNVTISLNSKIISQSATTGTVYSLGDVMYDFTFTEYDYSESDTDPVATSYTLSGLLETHNAVMINFWGITCAPCQAEFPAIQEAYDSYSDKLAIVALSSYGNDNLKQIYDFKTANNYSFFMTLDTPKIYTYFSVSGYPTSVIIDRYGVIAYWDTGTNTNSAIWKAIFNKYTSENYVQTPNTSSPDTPSADDWIKPTAGLTTPDSADIAAAINGVGTQGKVGTYYPETGENDKDYSWPWLIGEDANGKYIYASNSKASPSFSILYVTITLDVADTLSFDYFVDTEASGDILYVFINNVPVSQLSGQSQGWQTEKCIYTATHKVTINVAFCYMKNSSLDVGTDTAAIRNIRIEDIRDVGNTLDVQFAIINDKTLTNDKYDINVELNEADNYYYYTYVDEFGDTRTALLFADLLEVTPWAEMHVGTETFVPKDAFSSYPNSVYYISYWMMSNIYDTEINPDLKTQINYGYTDLLFQNYYIQLFAENYLVPVTPELKDLLQAFTKEYYAKDLGIGTIKDSWYEDQWLEFCYYFQHYGAPHEDDVCFETFNPAAGLTWETAIAVTEGEHSTEITKILNLGDGGGLKYKFTAPQTGVYYIYSFSCTEGTDPRIAVYNSDLKLLNDCSYDVSYDRFTNPLLDNAYLYVEMTAGEVYYIQTTCRVAGSLGSYKFAIEYAGDYVEFLRVCTTGDGWWIAGIGPDGEIDYNNSQYDAIPVVYNAEDGYYHELTKDNDYGSVIYIDFVHPNYYDNNNHTLYEFIKEGLFDDVNGVNYTDKMLAYYNSAIEGKDADDELYGMIEASDELVTIISLFMGELPESGGWLALACYYEYYGTPSAN